MAFRDLIVAGRPLGRSPIFTLTAAITIALGIGATTAIFTVATALLLRPLPCNDPERLVVLYSDLRARENFSMPFSNETFTDIRNGTRNAFEDLAAVQTFRHVLPGADGLPEQKRLGIVTINFLGVMGVDVAAGRNFEESDGIPQTPPGPPNDQAAVPPLSMMAILSIGHE